MNFDEHVDRAGGPDECHPWKAACAGNGYGAVRVNGRQQQSHRVAWVLANGPIPAGMQVCHHCDNPVCCNPAHLFLGTNRANMADKVAKRRQARGRANGRAKLTSEQVAYIKAHGGRRNNRTLGKKFGVSGTAVKLIVQGKTWKGSPAEESFAQAWGAEQPPQREYRFHPVRKWRFDFCWPEQKVAVEVDGRGRHQTVTGMRADYEKLNEAARLGWRVFRFPAIDRKKAAEWAALIREVLCFSEPANR